MGEYRIAQDFEIPADALWAAIRDFGDVGWLPGDADFESRGEGVGMIRTIRTSRLPTVREQLDAIDERDREIRYRILDGNPLPVRDYRAAMKVVDLFDGRSRLEWSSSWEPEGVSEEKAREAVAALYRVVLRGAKKNLERR